MTRHPVLIIGGPTASGKSGLALELAQRLDGSIVNADSMQVYGVLRVLTARPSPAEVARVPHHLYGIVPPAERMSAARWRDLALSSVRGILAQGRLPILVGGTGLYLRTLMQGIADIPDIPAAVRAEAQARHAARGGPAFHAELAARDPETAARLNPGDTQRLIRAWEVLAATGRSITDWQREGAAQVPADLDFITCVVEPPRDWLYARCDARFQAMLDAGALDEVRQLDALALDPDLPAMKALGVPDLLDYLHGRLSLAQATAQARQATRNYAKRQLTWFRHQLVAAHRIDPAALPDRNAVMKYCDSLTVGIRKKIAKTG